MSRLRRSLALPGVAALLALHLAPAARGEEWKPEVDKDGVRVWSRHVEGSRVHEIRATATVDFPAERVFAFLCDLDAYPQLMPLMKESRMLAKDDESALYYMVIDPPFIAPRDFCMRTSRARLPDGRLRAEWKAEAEGCPGPRKGFVRIQRNEGHWLLTPLPDGRTEVDYLAYTDPAGSVPKWVVNSGSPGAIVDVFAALKKATGLPKYAR